jgi:hypothetical protein
LGAQKEEKMIQRNGHPVVGFSSVASADPAPIGFCLPSGDAAIRLVRGDYGAIIDVGATMLMRGTLIAAGLAISGLRGAALLKSTVGATAAVEVGVLAWAWRNK